MNIIFILMSSAMRITRITISSNKSLIIHWMTVLGAKRT